MVEETRVFLCNIDEDGGFTEEDDEREEVIPSGEYRTRCQNCCTDFGEKAIYGGSHPDDLRRQGATWIEEKGDE
jgi:hypothetical protein